MLPLNYHVLLLLLSAAYLSQNIASRVITGIFAIFNVFHPSFFFFQLNIMVFDITLVVCFQISFVLNLVLTELIHF